VVHPSVIGYTELSPPKKTRGASLAEAQQSFFPAGSGRSTASRTLGCFGVTESFLFNGRVGKGDYVVETNMFDILLTGMLNFWGVPIL